MAALSLREGKAISRKAVLGGIDHMGTLRTGTPDEVKEQIFDAAREAGLVGLMIAPGCVITVDTPRENIQAIADAVRSIDPFSDEWEAHS
jgi:uroporphyrinogen-III decarboxylase